MPTASPYCTSPLLALFGKLAAFVVVLCLAAQPVVALAHELHEAQHPAPGAGPVHAYSTHAGETVPADDHAAGTLDALLHTMDCCAHGSVALVTPFPWTFTPTRVVHAPALASPAPTRPPARHLRPPISA